MPKESVPLVKTLLLLHLRGRPLLRPADLFPDLDYSAAISAAACRPLAEVVVSRSLRRGNAGLLESKGVKGLLVKERNEPAYLCWSNEARALMR
jgi:hypothetical protein